MHTCMWSWLHCACMQQCIHQHNTYILYMIRYIHSCIHPNMHTSHVSHYITLHVQWLWITSYGAYIYTCKQHITWYTYITYMHICINTLRTCIACLYAFIHSHTHPYIQTMHAYNSHIHADHTSTHTYIHTYTHNLYCIHTYIHTSMHVCKHTCMHTLHHMTLHVIEVLCITCMHFVALNHATSHYTTLPHTHIHTFMHSSTLQTCDHSLMHALHAMYLHM